jgi:hypothetical protein
MADTTLAIKDGEGNPQNLKVYDDGAGLVPYHAVSGAVDVNVTFPDTQPVSFEATSVLTASISNTVTVTSSYAQPAVVAISGSVPVIATTSPEYTDGVTSSSFSWDYIKSEAQGIGPSPRAKTLSIMNNADADLYILLGSHPASNTNYHICLAPYSLYESQQQNVKLEHSFILDDSASKGKVIHFITYKS